MKRLIKSQLPFKSFTGRTSGFIGDKMGIRRTSLGEVSGVAYYTVEARVMTECGRTDAAKLYPLRAPSTWANEVERRLRLLAYRR